MKKLITNILLFITSLASADTVRFGWDPNTEPDIQGYILRIGPALYGTDGLRHPELRDFLIPVEVNQATVSGMAPHEKAWLIAVDSTEHESIPAGPLEYMPVAVSVVVQSTRQGPLIAWAKTELFRIDETLFNPLTAELRTRLKITKDCLEVSFVDVPRTPIEYPVNVRANPDEFFRALVVVERP